MQQGIDALYTGPWNLQQLQQVPASEWGIITEHDACTLQQVYYEGEPYGGKPTRIFAYYAVPKGLTDPSPAIVLVHGGGGKAFAEWAVQWAEQGYVAIAMDLCGIGPDQERLADAGPEMKAFGISAELQEMWEYHAVAAVVRAVSLLQSRAEVDPATIGMMGISWGGYLTDIATSFDQRVAYAMPVYSAGNFKEGSCWLAELEAMGQAGLQEWERNYDIMSYIGQSRVPMFRATGTNDNCFYLNNWKLTYEAAKGEHVLRLLHGWEHGYAPPWEAKEFVAYANARVQGGQPLPDVHGLAVADQAATTRYTSACAVTAVKFYYTEDDAAWPEKAWTESEASHDPEQGICTAELPEHALAWFFTLEDARGFIVSSELGLKDQTEASNG